MLHALVYRVSICFEHYVSSTSPITTNAYPTISQITFMIDNRTAILMGNMLVSVCWASFGNQHVNM